VDSGRCILVGYGPVGATVHRILKDTGTRLIVIELNLDTVRRLRAEGYEVIYGDVLRPGTLADAGVGAAGSLILGAEFEDGAEIVRQARMANPNLRVLARCSHLRDAAALRNAGATVVVGEAEVAVALAEAALAGDERGTRELAEHIKDLRRHLYDQVSAH
jgi:CPA2 family monovalent cation:H+ antiporter-2